MADTFDLAPATGRTGSSAAVMRYPASITDTGPYVLFSRHRAQYSGEATQGQNITAGRRGVEGIQGTASGIVLEEVGKVAMYMPMGVSIADNMVYENVSTGVLGSLIEAGMDIDMDAVKAAIAEGPEAMMDAAGSALDAVTSDMGDINAVGASRVGATAAAGGAAAIGSMISRTPGLASLAKIGLGSAALGIGANTAFQEAQKSIQSALNPREFLLFKSPGMRSFSFSFRFIPESDTEARTVDDIIKWFRTGMYPDITNLGFGYKFPDAFAVKFENTDGIPYLPEMYLESASTTFNPNSMSYYKSANGGRPVEVNLSLTFKELQPLNRQLVNMGF